MKCKCKECEYFKRHEVHVTYFQCDIDKVAFKYPENKNCPLNCEKTLNTPK